MAKKKVTMEKEILDEILNEQLLPVYSEDVLKRDLEEDIDEEIKRILSKSFDKKNVIGKKTGIKKIDNAIPSYHGENGHGRPDVMIFNVFGKNEISMLIENKNFSSNEDALDQAETYAQVGYSLEVPCRVIVGNNPGKDLKVNVLVNDEYKPLKVNGRLVKYFLGYKMLKLIYDNPNINEFVLEEHIDKAFTQKDFHNVINSLRNIYRQVKEIQNNNENSINFTVAFVALKMIMEKNAREFNSIKTIEDVFAELSYIVTIPGKERNLNKELNKKYKDIFIITKKEGDDEKEIFSFYKLIKAVDLREMSEDIPSNESKIIEIKDKLSAIPKGDIQVDLFGEVYECLASKKTKKTLGEYFTRRHIIQAIVRMLLTEDNINDIVESKRTVCDPFCGTGGFLTESFKYIKEYYEKSKPKASVTKLAEKIMIGYDLNDSSIGRTRINMTLAGDGFSNIECLNTLTDSRVKKNISYILTNVPYGKGDIAIKDIQNEDEFIKNNNIKRLELNGVIKVIQMLKKGGKAAIIVPEGLVEAPSLAGFRLYLMKNCKINVILSLPKHAFAPYTKWKTYVLLLEKRQKPFVSIDELIAKNEKIWAYIVDNDGYANSDKRFPTSLTEQIVIKEELVYKDGHVESVSEEEKYNRYLSSDDVIVKEKSILMDDQEVTERKYYLDTHIPLHNELSSYIDVDGIEHSSILEQKYEAREEDEKKEWKNEWNEPIIGKKYGYISIHEITSKKIEKYQEMSITKVNALLKTELKEHKILGESTYDELRNEVSINKDGEYSPVKADYIEKIDDIETIKDAFIPIFEEMQLEYDVNSGKFQNLKEQEIVYSLPLVPEKYFRKKKDNFASLEEMSRVLEGVKKSLKTILGGITNES